MRAERASKPRLRLSLVVAVAVGGAIGAVVRHLLDTTFPVGAGNFVWTTFAINVSGAFLLALLPAFAAVRRHAVLPPLLGTGALGGYTTLSAYSEQTRALLDAGRAMTALGYLFGTLAAALIAVAIADHFSTYAERVEFEDEEGDL